MATATRTVRVAPFPEGTLGRQIVESGGKSFLLGKKLIPSDKDAVYGVLAVDIQPWATQFGGYKLALAGATIKVKFGEDKVFVGGSSDVQFVMDLEPFDIAFMNNVAMSPWKEGHVEVEKGYVVVYPPGTKEKLANNENRKWCYRVMVVAETNIQACVVVQVLPLDIATIKSSAWVDSEFIGGV